MKKILTILSVLFCTFSVNAQGILIKGELKYIPDNTVVTLLDGMLNKEVSTDKVIGGKFTLNATTEFPSVFVIGFNGLPYG